MRIVYSFVKSKVTNRKWRKIQKVWLHIILIASTLMYLFTPLLDHLLENGEYSRPHTHILISETYSFDPHAHHSDEPFLHTEVGHEHAEGAEFYLCLLDFNAFSALALIDPGLAYFHYGHEILVFWLPISNLLPQKIFLSFLDPPPRI